MSRILIFDDIDKPRHVHKPAVGIVFFGILTLHGSRKGGSVYVVGSDNSYSGKLRDGYVQEDAADPHSPQSHMQ